MAETAAGQRGVRKTRTGVVMGRSGRKSVTVRVERRMQHPLYGKVVRQVKKYHAHDESDSLAAGTKVRIAETRPLSRLKRWRVVDVLSAS